MFDVMKNCLSDMKYHSFCWIYFWCYRFIFCTYVKQTIKYYYQLLIFQTKLLGAYLYEVSQLWEKVLVVLCMFILYSNYGNKINSIHYIQTHFITTKRMRYLCSLDGCLSFVILNKNIILNSFVNSSYLLINLFFNYDFCTTSSSICDCKN